jgi:electron transfer flavoprotein alpha subunit
MILIIVEPVNGNINKGGFELASYGFQTSKIMNQEAHALIIGQAQNGGDLGQYGISKAHQINHAHVEQFDSQVYSTIIHKVAESLGAETVILRHTSTGKSIAGRLAIKMNASLVSGATTIPEMGNHFSVKKSVYSGKAIVEYQLNNPKKVLTLTSNSIQPTIVGQSIQVENLQIEIPAPKIKVLNTSKPTGLTPLPEAEKVVSAGRGLKDPQNWGIIEDLASTLGATTACSRPVADIGWRPHHEHVGQTGVAIRPNLYVAIGISGAIQHLAGVNNSKTIVVINKDPEAPFFKAADYGVVGDLFEIVPKLNEAIKKFQSQQ